jgi:septal ring factor EnvC (AmiA/AmiB activator)
MNILGKIFVFAVFIMSLVFMSFAVAIFASHTNWKAEAERLEKELAADKDRRGQLLETIDSLQSQVRVLRPSGIRWSPSCNTPSPSRAPSSRTSRTAGMS